MRDATCNSGKRDSQWAQFSNQMQRGGFAINGRGSSDDDLADLITAYPFGQRLRGKLLGGDSGQGGQQLSEYEIPAFDRVASLEGN